MTNLHVTDLTEVLSHMPVVCPLDDVMVDSVDLLLCASGFEPRVTSVAEFLINRSVRVHFACYLTYRDNDSANRRARRGLLKNLERLTGEIETVDGDSASQDFSARLGEVLDRLIRTSSGTRRRPVVVFDVSSASTRLILRALYVLWRHDIHLLLAYSQAETYLPTPEEYSGVMAAAEKAGIDGDASSVSSVESLGLEDDIRDPEYSLEYPGVHLDNLPDRVVVIAGFNGRRSKAALEYVDPALAVDHPNPRVIWIVGEPLELGDRWRVDAMLRVNGLSASERTDGIRFASTLDYRETLRILEESYIHHYASERITVAPMGSKMQTVGLSLFCELHPDARVVLARPVSHSGRKYSRGMRQQWGIDFGSTVNVQDRLASVGEARLFD